MSGKGFRAFGGNSGSRSWTAFRAAEMGQGSMHPVSVPRAGEAADALCEVLSRLKWRRRRFTGQTVQTTPE